MVKRARGPRVPMAGVEVKVPDFVFYIGQNGQKQYVMPVTKTGGVASRMGAKVLDLKPVKKTGYIPPPKKSKK